MKKENQTAQHHGHVTLVIDRNKVDCRVRDKGDESGRILIEVAVNGEMKSGPDIKADLMNFGMPEKEAERRAEEFVEEIWNRGLIETIFS